MEKKIIFKKYFVIGIAFLFLGSSVLQFATSKETLLIKTFYPTEIANDCDWIVDDEGDGDFDSIQEAIENASECDTICVYSGNYSEDITIEKCLNIIGKDEEYGTGDGTDNPYIIGDVTIQGQNILFKNFTVHSGVTLIASTDVTLSNLITSDLLSGIFLINSDNNTIGKCFGDILNLDNSNDNTVQYCNFSQGWGTKAIAIILTGSHYNILQNNNCSANCIELNYGIYLNESNYNTLLYNKCTARPNPFFPTPDSTIKLFSSNYNKLINNTCFNSEIGIFIDVSSNNDIIDNNCTNNEIGIKVEGFSNNDIIGNNCTNNEIGIKVEDSSENDIIENTIKAGKKDDNAIELVFSNNNYIFNNVLEGEDIGNIGIYLDNSYYNLIDRHEIKNFTIGIRLVNSEKEGEKNNEITWNTITYNKYGMQTENTKGNLIRYNTFSYNHICGIYLENSIDDNIWQNNICYNEIKELIAYSSIGYYPGCWWGSPIGCIGKITEIDSGIKCFPWAKQAGPPWPNARTDQAQYLPKIFELFPILQRILNLLL